MANRMKEDEKNERIIRGLLKLPENRKCVNCNSLGPQYVCTNFWTFVCTTCGGIHREFTHRVKSISMAKFSSQEVAALQGGGNSQAKEIYLKEFDPQRQSFPDSSNVERLRNFIKHVYVDRRYTGDRSSDKPPRVKMGDELYEHKRSDTFQGGPQGPPYEDAYERRHSSRPSSGGRSDDSNYRYNYEERRSPNYSDHKRSPSRLEVVNDWRREDRFGDGRKTEDHRISDGDFKTESRSPVRIPSPPVVRPVREILGENVPPIRILEPPKANGGRDGPSQRQRTNSSSSSASTSGNLVEHTADVSASLIDFDADPQPSVASAVPETKQTTSVQSQPVNSLCDTNWASFDFPTEAKISQSPPVTNTLNSVLSQLSIPSSGPGNLTTMSTSGGTAVAPMGTMPILPNRGNIPIAPLSHTLMSTPAGGVPTPFPVDSLSAFTPSNPAPASHWTSVMSVNCNYSFAEGSSATPWFKTQAQQHSLYPATGIQSSAQQLTASVEASSNLPWASSLASNAQGPTSASPTQALQAVSKSTLEVASGVMPQPSPVEVKSSGRRELSEDLFASRYPSNSLPIPGWQAGGPGVLGFGMQYNTEAAFQSYLQPSRSTNPFDLNNDSAQLQTPSFPSMTSLQGALPNMPTPRALMHHPQAPSYTYAMPPGGGSMGEQLPGGIHPSGHQGHGGFGSSGASFGSLNSNQPPAGSYPGSVNPSSFSSFGGNPFG